MQRASFTSLKTSNPEVFVVKIDGHLGTRQKKAVEGLVEKCRQNGKNRIIFEFSKLESLGGAVANLLGTFAGELADQGYPPHFVGASDVVQAFLRGRFTKVAPIFVDDLAQAEAALSGGPIDAQRIGGNTDDARADSGGGAVYGVEDIFTPAPQSTAGATKPSRSPPASAPTAADPAAASENVASPEAPREPARAVSADDAANPADSRRHYFTLEEAEQWLADAKSHAEEKVALAGLLFGADLADRCFLFHRGKGGLVETEDPNLQMPLDGALAKVLIDRRGPVPIVDLSETELSDAEEDVLSELNCQMAVPLLADEALEGVLFLRKRQAGLEYEAGEALALDLLVRYMARRAGASKQAAAGDGGRELKERVYKYQTLARVSKELNSIKDEEHLLNILLLTLITELGVGRVAFYDVSGDSLTPRCARGVEIDDLPSIPAMPTAELDEWTQVLIASGPIPKPLKKIMKEFTAAKLDLVAPLRTKDAVLGAVGLGEFRNGDSAGIDQDFLATLLQHAGVAVENTITYRNLHQQSLHVARTVMTLAAKRAGLEEETGDERATYYVGQVARAMNYAPEDLRDLMYGTVLRDIGMIEISDLVLRSPRRLSPEEWKLVQRHPITGVEILQEMGFGQHACDVVRHHHERFNGEGYPHSLRGNAIPLGARILAVVESFLAMTRDLPYRAALSRREAVDVIRENWEMRYDPEVVEAFIRVVEAEDDTTPRLDEVLASY